MICSTTTPCESRSSKSPGVAETLIICGTSDMNSSNWSGRLSSARRQPEAVLDQRELARAVAVEHAADLRQRDVRLVDHDEEVRREVVEQAGRALARRAGRDRWRE